MWKLHTVVLNQKPANVFCVVRVQLRNTVSRCMIETVRGAGT